MGLWQGRSKKKPSGGRIWPFRKKRLRNIGRDPVLTKVSDKDKRIKLKARGGSQYDALLTVSYANLDLGNGKFKKVKIKRVIENKANRHFVRMNVVTRGAVVETDAGNARVTSRPAREGVVNAVLVK
jgi:small subunit ribosomal protein S8e